MPRRNHLSRAGLFTLVAATLAFLTGGAPNGFGQDPPPPGPANRLSSEPADAGRLTSGGPIAINAPDPAVSIATGHGRMSINFDGNRRWCTFADDRMSRPPMKSIPGSKRREEVYTFGYQFAIAAFERSDPGTTLLLFSSPVIRTASLRQAGKLGRGWKAAPQGPLILPSGEPRGVSRPHETPATIVPFWDDKKRCAVVGKQFEFDLDPGIYDVYIAFDLMLRSGTWVHRSSGYLTDIRVEDGNRTVVDGFIETRGGGNRSVDLRKFSVLPADRPGSGRR